MKKFIWIASFMQFIYSFVFGQLLINEICPANNSVIQNPYGQYDDYIEIYNSGVHAVDLGGYGLSDQADSTERFHFSSYNLNPGEHLLVFASGQDVVPPVDHYEMPVNGNGIWNYYIGSSHLDSNWSSATFDDSQWQSGEGGIGFGDEDDATVISPCRSVMLRQSFVVNDPSRILNAFLMIDFDDGFVAYLNGVEIARFNMYPGIPDWDDLASDAHEAGIYQGLSPDSFAIDRDLFNSAIQTGKNVLSVEVHNVTANSSDLSAIPFLFTGVSDSRQFFPAPPTWFHPSTLSVFGADFKLRRSGETIYLFNPDGNILDQVSYPNLETDHCYNRTSDGEQNWCYSNLPTPLLPNSSSNCYNGYALPPVFSFAGGFYQSGIILNLSTSLQGAEIRFSTNGNDPQMSDQLYTHPITIDSTTTIRARVFAPGMLPGKTIGHTYFIDEASQLPVFSISMDSLDLWDENSGIYAAGPNADPSWPHFGANYWRDWTKPAAFEFFDKSKQHIFSFNAEIEIYGNYSRAEVQKSFEIKLSDKFGMDALNYPLISDKPYLSNYENIVLRNSGTDWNVVHFRDALMERLMKSTYSGYLAAEPVRVFLNGRNWGVYTINEKHNHTWVETNYNLKKSEIDFLTEIGDEIITVDGSANDFWALYNYSTTQSPSDQHYYDQINSMLDLQNYADYFIAETFYNNGDWIGEWTNNIKMWKPKAPGSRWKYLLHDLDFGFDLHGDVTDNRLELARNPDAFSYSSEMFDAILYNEKFKNYFINRYADLLNTIYLPANVETVMKSFKDSMALDMVKHFEKWGGDTDSWHSNIDDMMQFVNQRPEIARSMILEQFSLSGKVHLELNVLPAGAGRIEISTVTPETFPWTGVYFNGNPVTITAIPNPGFTFDHWGSGQLSGYGGDQSVTINFTWDQQVVAYFSGSAKYPQLNISEFNYHSTSAFNSEDWLEFYNYGSFDLDISGWKVSDELDHHIYKFPTGTVIPSNEYIVLAKDTVAFDNIFPTRRNRLGQMGFGLDNTEGQIRLFDHTGTTFRSLYYQSELPWPPEAAGFGYTCESQIDSGDLSNGNNWLPGCFGGSPGGPSTNALAVDINISGPNILCSGSEIALEAPEFPDAVYQWVLEYQDLPGEGNNTLSTNEPGVYSIHVNAHGCIKTSNTFIVSEKSTATAPFVTNESRCGPGYVLLRATAQDSVFWFDRTDGEALASGETFLTPFMQTSSTYFVRSGKDCPSTFVSITASVFENCDSSVSVFPNPSTKNSHILIQIAGLKPGVALVHITDSQGQLVKSIDLNLPEQSTTCSLDIQDLDEGIYFVNVLQKDVNYTTKILRLE